MLDITLHQRELLQRLLGQRLPHATAIAFGSRVSGWPFGQGAKPYSDLDVALIGLSPADDLAVANLRADLEDSNIPWRVDLSHAQDLSASLRGLVEEHGEVLQGQRESTATI